MGNELEQLNDKAVEIVDVAKALEVTNQLQYDKMAGLIKTCKEIEKKIKDFFQPTIDKFKKVKSEAEAGRKSEVKKMEMYLSPTKTAKDIMVAKVKSYEDELERQRVEREEKQKEVAEEWGEDSSEVKVESSLARQTGLGVSRRWQFEVEDKALLPIEFLEPNMVAIRKYMMENKENAKMQGVRFFHE